MWEKVVIIGGCNFVMVFIVKAIEEKLRKDKLWKIEVTIPSREKDFLLTDCQKCNIRHFNYFDIDAYYIFNFYCKTQEESAKVKNVLKEYNAKYFVSETKIL